MNTNLWQLLKQNAAWVIGILNKVGGTSEANMEFNIINITQFGFFYDVYTVRTQ